MYARLWLWLVVILVCKSVKASVESPLLLTEYIRDGRIAEARYVSRFVADGRFLGHSGFFEVPAASGTRINQLFFWFQPCTDGCDPSSAPLLQWFNGGPGSPDTTGALNQIGQFYVDERLQLRERCFSWCKKNNCLFIDSPTMTGYSYQTDPAGTFDPTAIKYTATSSDATQQTLAVLTQFLQVWPEYQAAPYYLAGVSYGGHYVPWMAHTVLAHNHAIRQRQPLHPAKWH